MAHQKMLLTRCWGWLAAPGLVLAVTGLAFAQTAPEASESSRDALARQIRQKVTELEEIRQQREAARRSHQEALAGLEQQISRLRADLTRVEEQLEDHQTQIDTRRQKLNEARTQRDRAKALITGAAEAAEPIAGAMHERVRGGVPFKRTSRAQRVDAARQSLQANQPITQAEGVMELLGFAGKELNRGRSIALTNRPVVLDPGAKRKHAHVLRLGLAGAGFVSEDGTTFGLAAHEPGVAWRLEISQKAKRRLSDAVAIMRENHPPELIALPLTATVDRGSASAPQPASQNARAAGASEGGG